MRHADYRTTLKHYTALRIEDHAAALASLGSIVDTEEVRSLRTGTTGGESPAAGRGQNDPQLCTQPGDSVQPGATLSGADHAQSPLVVGETGLEPATRSTQSCASTN